MEEDGEDDITLKPILDADLANVIAAMRGQQLATDQMLVAERALDGRSLSCRQGGQILGTVVLGIMQRKLAIEVLHGRLNDLPDGVPDLLVSLEGEIRKDVEAVVSGVAPSCLSYKRRKGAGSFRRSSPSLSFTPEIGSLPSLGEVAAVDVLPKLVGGPDSEDPMERLRRDICTHEVPESIYDDVSAVFETLGLPPLPARELCRRRPESEATSKARSMTPLAPSAVAVGFSSSGGAATPVVPPLQSGEVPMSPGATEDAEYLRQLELFAAAQDGYDAEDAARSHVSEESV